MEETAKAMMKQAVGITDEDWDRMGPGIKKLCLKASELAKYRLVAEVIDSKYCFAQIKKGDKFILNGPVLDVKESTCPPCVEALGPLTYPLRMFFDRLAEGVDPNGMVFSHFECLDTGIENGGLGKVKFKVYVEKLG